MKELAHHIGALLLEQGCAIVPSLGGFVARRVAAHYDETQGKYFPPQHEVAFNPALTTDDGMLRRCYMEARGISYTDAARSVAEATAAAKQQLQESKELVLERVGRLTMLDDGFFDFTPAEDGVFSPSLYGLVPIEASLARTEANHTRVELAPTEHEEKPARVRNYTLHIKINKELVNYVATAVIALFVYFAWSSPVGIANAGDGQPTLSAVRPANAVQPQRTTTPEICPEVKVDKPREAAVATPAPEATPAKQGRYTIVLMSCIPMKSAERVVQELTDEGMTGVEVLLKGTMVRVAYGRYADENEAYNAAHRLRASDKRFNDAWVLELN